MKDNNKPYTVYRVEGSKPPKRWPRLLLIAALCVVGVLIVGGATAYIWLHVVLARTQDTDPTVVSSLNETTTTAAGAGSTTEPLPDPPGSQNIIVFGSDNKEADEEYGRSDSIMLVHVDSSANFVSVLSLPRDLRVEIPGYDTEKLNAAYSFGGAALAIKTVQQLTGVDLDSYVNVDFDAFRALTTKLGGVWIDVDRRYYHQAQVGSSDPWENIDIQPGYQRLMGEDALDFVRFRHDDNYDFGRMERQQLFLREAQRQLVSPATALKLPELVSLIAGNVKTSLNTNQILSLAWFGLHLNGSRIKSVKLEGDTQTINDVSYVVLDEDTLRAKVEDFLTPPGEESSSGGSSTEQTGDTSGPASSSSSDQSGATSLDAVRIEVLNGNGRSGQAGAAAELLRGKGADVFSIGDAPASSSNTVVSYPAGEETAAQAVVDTLSAGSTKEDISLDHIKVVLGQDFYVEVKADQVPGRSGIIYESEYLALQSEVSFPLMGPGYLPPDYEYKDRRVYQMDAGGGKQYPAVKTIYKFKDQDQYLGIMQTTFVNAPVAADGEKVTQGGVTYTIVGIAEKTDRVWWKKGDTLYWVSNTLMHLLTRDELVRVATGMIAVKQ